MSNKPRFMVDKYQAPWYKRVMDTQRKAIQDAVKAAGGQSALARALGVYQGAVWNWLDKGRVPPNRVIPIEKITGVSRHRLDPVIYPEDDAAA